MSVKTEEGGGDEKHESATTFYDRCKRIPWRVYAAWLEQRSVREIARSMVYGRALATVLRMANGELNGRQIQVIKPRIYTRQQRPSFRSKDILNFSRFHNFFPPSISSNPLRKFSKTN